MKLKIKGKKIVAEMPQKETRIKHMQDTIKKIFISYTKIGICKSTKSENVHKYSFSFYTYITYLF